MNVLIVSGKVKYPPSHGVSQSGKGSKYVALTIVSANTRTQRDDYYNVIGFGKVAEALEGLQIGQDIIATGLAVADVREKDGKHYGNLKCYASNIELIGGDCQQKPKIDPADYPPKEFANQPAQKTKSSDDDVPF